MALTPEDIVNKRFQSTKFREGYDQDEVDDFLDEVVVEMRRLTEENDALKAELEQAQTSAASAPAAADEASSASVSPVSTASTVAADDPIDAEGTANLLQLARRLHEEHVREGIQRRDELIAEGHAQAARIVSEAEDEHKRKMTVFEQERSTIQNTIDQLRSFESEYRYSLRGFIENQLATLDSAGVESSLSSSAPAASSE